MRARCRVRKPSRTRRTLAAIAAVGGMVGAASCGWTPGAMASGALAGIAAGSSLGIGSLFLLLAYAPAGKA